jgi:TonB family protein
VLKCIKVPALQKKEFPPRNQASPLLAPFAISVGFHLMMLPFFGNLFTGVTNENIGQKLEVTRVKLVDPQLNQNLDLKGQVVELNDNNKSIETPENSNFLSDRNRRVEKEMQARNTGSASSGEDGGSPSASKPKPKGKGFNLDVPKEYLTEQSKPGTGRGKSGRMASTAPSNYLPSIAFGDETLLNTKEYVFASFFVRMKQQIEAHWQPLQWVDRYRESENEFTTVLDITLKGDGYLNEAKVVGPSGRPYLDREALNAVRKGGPFLNPPKGLVERDGLIRLGSIRFVVVLRGRI